MLIIPTIYNYILQRKNAIRVIKRPALGFVLAIFAIIISLICYKIDKTLLGSLTVLAAVLLIYTIGFFPGIGENGINIFMGFTPILKFISFDKIKSIDVKEIDDNLNLSIKAFGDTYKQIYDIKNREDIFNILEENNLIIGDL